MYHQGIQHIAIAGGDGPDELKDDREQWLHEVQVSAIHEVVHYWQELNGTIGEGDYEDEAEEMSRELVESLAE